MKKITAISIIFLLLLVAYSAYLTVNKSRLRPEPPLQGLEEKETAGKNAVQPVPGVAEETGSGDNGKRKPPSFAGTPAEVDRMTAAGPGEGAEVQTDGTGSPKAEDKETEDFEEKVETASSESGPEEVRKKTSTGISAGETKIKEKPAAFDQPVKEPEKIPVASPKAATEKKHEVTEEPVAAPETVKEKPGSADRIENKPAKKAGDVRTSVKDQDITTREPLTAESTEFIQKEVGHASPVAVLRSAEGVIEQPSAPGAGIPSPAPDTFAGKVAEEAVKAENGTSEAGKAVETGEGTVSKETAVTDAEKSADRDREEPVKEVPGEAGGKAAAQDSARTLNADKRIAVLSFDNFSDTSGALELVMPAVRIMLEEKGFTTVSERRVNDFLCEEKVRTSSYISNKIMRKVSDRFIVNTILAGAVVSFSSGDNPRIGLMSRLINASTGNVLWADFVSFSGDDFAAVLGLGKIKSIEKLVLKAVDKLFDSFAVTGTRQKAGSARRIAILPFRNKSEFSNAGMIAMYMFMVEILKNYEFQPIEYGEIRKLIVDLRIRSRGALDYGNLDVLSDALGAGGVLVGTVERYFTEVNSSLPPEVAITARLLDARMKEIVWYNSLQRNGEKKVILFGWDRTLPVDKVAYNVVSDLVEKMISAGQADD